ncbi:MAG: hypothetical protein V1750_04430 [Acidobacteriota bacterium]
MRDARPWTYAALFGSLWAAAEIVVGTLLSVAHVPMFGTLMASVGVVCMVTARRLQPAPGATLVMGLVVAFLKVFFAGGLALGAVVGILSQALLVELAMCLTGSRAPGAIIGGALALPTAHVQRFLVAWLVTGSDTVAAFDRALQGLGASFGVKGSATLALLAYLVAFNMVLGVLIGAFAWRVAGRVRGRLRGRA